MTTQIGRGVDWPNLTAGRDYTALDEYVFDIHLRIELANADVLKEIEEAFSQSKKGDDRYLRPLRALLKRELKNRGRDNEANVHLVEAIQSR